MNLYLDIETLPANDDVLNQLRFLYDRKVEKWAKRKELDAETSANENGNGDNFDKYYKNTCFDGSFGRILCIAYAIDNEEVDVICYQNDEKRMLEKFWGIAKDANLFIGHNVLDFDLRFIYQRSIIHGVRPSRDLNFARYRNNPIYDTMREWTKWGGSVGLEHLAIALGIPTPKEGIDGSQVFDFYKAGKIDDICEYCKRDVETTRAIYKRMVFATLPTTKTPLEHENEPNVANQRLGI